MRIIPGSGQKKNEFRKVEGARGSHSEQVTIYIEGERRRTHVTNYSNLA